MLEKIRQLLGGREIPDEVGVLYRGARDEREALILLKEARRRDEARRRRGLQDLEVLERMEEQLLEEGRNEETEGRRLALARRIKEIRWKKDEIRNRVENIYSKRIQIFSEHIQSLETVIELESEPLPSREAMEKIAIRAREMMDDLERTYEVARGICMTTESQTPDAEEREIMREFERAADEELERHEIRRTELEAELGERAAETERPRAGEEDEEAELE
jgi:hypothetical protein